MKTDNIPPLPEVLKITGTAACVLRALQQKGIKIQTPNTRNAINLLLSLGFNQDNIIQFFVDNSAKN